MDNLHKILQTNCLKEKCKLCDLSSDLDTDLPCRVCGYIFHKACLSKSGKYNAFDLTLTERAFTMIGWSCCECDNIMTLLTPGEMMSNSDTFDLIDINKDGVLSVEEYLDFRSKITGTEFVEADIKRETLQFQLLDVNCDKKIDFEEFMKNEAVHMLANRDKTELVNMLHPLEIKSAWKMFQLLDENSDGTIDILEAKNKGFYRRWYDTLRKVYDMKFASQSDKGSMGIGLHAVVNTSILLDSDENDDGVVDWKEFLRGQALFIVAARPNKANLEFKL